MPYFKDGKVLFVGGQVASSKLCCCPVIGQTSLCPTLDLFNGGSGPPVLVNEVAITGTTLNLSNVTNNLGCGPPNPLWLICTDYNADFNLLTGPPGESNNCRYLSPNHTYCGIGTSRFVMELVYNTPTTEDNAVRWQVFLLHVGVSLSRRALSTPLPLLDGVYIRTGVFAAWSYIQPLWHGSLCLGGNYTATVISPPPP